MPATLDDILAKVTSQDDQIKQHSTALASVVETQSVIQKALEKPNRGGAMDVVPATPIDHAKEAMWGFNGFGDFLNEIRLAGIKKSITPRLETSYKAQIEKAIVGANEATGSEGGYLVPPEFSSKLFARVYTDSALLPKCDNYTVTGNSMTFPRSGETSRATGSRWGGVQIYWAPEGGAGTLTKPAFGQLMLKLHKIIGLAGVTDELLLDQSVMPQYLLRAFSDEIDFIISDAIIRGTGAGQPLGILNAACKIAQAAETSQVAATINAQNVVKMFSRIWAGSRKNVVWLYNQDIEPQLLLMTLGIGTAGVTVYMPPGGLSGASYGTLLGRPMIPIEQANTLGTEGDLMAVDLSQYVTIGKGGVNNAQSMHFYFDTDQMAFRITIRIDGQPWWSAPLTPYKGTATQSCFVTLATRS